MGIGHNQARKQPKQQSLLPNPYAKFNRFTFGGNLRNTRKGRTFRPLSLKHPVHLVFKVERKKIRRGLRSYRGFAVCTLTLKKYAKRFAVKIEQQAICGDHIHVLARFTHRSWGQHFMRVVAGQIAQTFKNEGFWVTGTRSMWKHRPFSRVVFGERARKIARDYVRLNRLESEGRIPYRKERLKGLTEMERRLVEKGDRYPD